MPVLSICIAAIEEKIIFKCPPPLELDNLIITGLCYWCIVCVCDWAMKHQGSGTEYARKKEEEDNKGSQ